LIGGFTTAKSVELNDAGIELHLAAHEPMGPERIEREGMTQETDAAVIIGSAQKDQATARVESPSPI